MKEQLLLSFFKTCKANFPAVFLSAPNSARIFITVEKTFFISIIESKDQVKPLEIYLETKMFILEKHSGSVLPLRLLILTLSPLIYSIKQIISRKSFVCLSVPRGFVGKYQVPLQYLLVFFHSSQPNLWMITHSLSLTCSTSHYSSSLFLLPLSDHC